MQKGKESKVLPLGSISRILLWLRSSVEPKGHVTKVCAGPNFMHSESLWWIVGDSLINLQLERFQIFVLIKIVMD